ncbi:MAG: hypothetical protein K8S54_03030 [Spirochaetia bacterium]|nr:hypothetical protein [Spirochaetia bacterium]
MTCLSRRASSALFTFFLLGAVSVVAQPMMTGEPQAGNSAGKKATIFGSVVNGTTGLAGQPEEIQLLRPGQTGMQVLQTIRPGTVNFRFDPVPVQGPVLVRCLYAGETYIHVVPPTEKFYTAPQRVMIYEVGAKPDDILITSGLQVVKHKEAMKISRVFAIENRSNPPKAFAGAGLKFFVSPDAKNVKAQLQHQGSMPVPNALSPDGHLVRGIRPGNSELTLEYDMPGFQLEERAQEFAGSPSKHAFLVVVFQPADAKPKVEGAQTEEIQIPNLGPALRINFGNDPAKLDFSNGGYIIENPLSSDVNAVFDETWKVLLALLFAIIILFLAASVLASSGVSFVRQKSNPPN